jgi:hypothetical protein
MNSSSPTQVARQKSLKAKAFLSFGKKRDDDDDDDDIQGGLGAVATLRAMFPRFTAGIGGPAVA